MTGEGGCRDRDTADGLKRFKESSFLSAVSGLSAWGTGRLIDRLSLQWDGKTPQVDIGIILKATRLPVDVCHLVSFNLCEREWNRATNVAKSQPFGSWRLIAQ